MNKLKNDTSKKVIRNVSFLVAVLVVMTMPLLIQRPLLMSVLAILLGILNFAFE